MLCKSSLGLFLETPRWFIMPETAAALKIRSYYVVISCDFWIERSHIPHSSYTTPHTLLLRRKSLLSLLIKLLKFNIAG